jgi:hypothetical protein
VAEKVAYRGEPATPPEEPAALPASR